MRSQRQSIRIQKLSDQGKESDLKATTPVERLEMVWQLTLDAWAFKGEPDVESRLRRDIVRVVRRTSRHKDRADAALLEGDAKE